MKPHTTPARRRHPRIEIDGGHGAQDLTLGHYVHLRDVSLGGFQTESPRQTEPGSVHTFRVVLHGGGSCVVRAAAIHCREAPGGRHAFIVGWQAASDPVTVSSIVRLIDEVTTVAQSEVRHP
jgi:hypothetical protein